MMKYEKPEIDVIEFQIAENITDDNVNLDSGIGGDEGVDDDF